MVNKKKVTTAQYNKLVAEIPEKREKIKAQIEFRHELIESQKRINYKNEFDRLQGAKKIIGLDANAKSRMQELQKKARQSLNGEPSHRIYSTKF
jgi:UDP-3-O-acyl-N-acetylglucosamine deacetylase